MEYVQPVHFVLLHLKFLNLVHMEPSIDSWGPQLNLTVHLVLLVSTVRVLEMRYRQEDVAGDFIARVDHILQRNSRAFQAFTLPKVLRRLRPAFRALIQTCTVSPHVAAVLAVISAPTKQW